MKRLDGFKKKKKLVNKIELEKIAQALQRIKKTIVTTNGSFDIFHAGHLHLLKKAKSLGDVLIVGLNSDLSIKKYKSKDRPIIAQRFRTALLSAIEYVDYVYIFNETNPIKFLEIVRPDIHVNSAEYGKNCIEAPTVKKFGGRLILVQKKKEFLSKTEIIRKILKAYSQPKK